MTRTDRRLSRLVVVTSVASLAATATRGAAQVPDTAPPQPYRQTTAFPVAVGAALSSGRYGDRAMQPAQPQVPEATHRLASGLAIGARVQAPLTRRIGVFGGASITRRNRLVEEGDNPLSAEDKVTVIRADGGLGYRFRPNAPIFFGASFVYQRHSPGPVEFQTNTVTEIGGGIGIGYDFARSTRHDFFGRLEVWNYWVQPSATGLAGGYEAKSLARDLSIALSVNYRIPATVLRRRR
jgi:hypothetical protein